MSENVVMEDEVAATSRRPWSFGGVHHDRASPALSAEPRYTFN